MPCKIKIILLNVSMTMLVPNRTIYNYEYNEYLGNLITHKMFYLIFFKHFNKL